jgi:hypothetical protein
MRSLRWLSLAAVLATLSCGSSDNRTPPGGGLGGSTGVTPQCGYRPTDLLQPPNGRLPCELIPPGVHL